MKRALQALSLLACVVLPQLADATGYVCGAPYKSRELCSSGEPYYCTYTCTICGGIGKVCNYSG